MLEIQRIRENKNRFILGLSKRNIEDSKSIVDKLIQVDDRRKMLKKKSDNILSKHNKISKEIGINVNKGDSTKIKKLKKENTTLKQENKKIAFELKSVEKKIHDLLINLPNIPHKSVPSGNKEEDNEIIITSKKTESIKGKIPHWELIEKHDIIDFELGNKITGAGFPVYKKKGAKLQRALINYFLDEATKKGYEEIQPPILVNEKSGFCTGQIPDKEGQMYKIESENLYLIPTAEVPITNVYRDQIIIDKSLPIKNVAYTPCFR